MKRHCLIWSNGSDCRCSQAMRKREEGGKHLHISYGGGILYFCSDVAAATQKDNKVLERRSVKA